MKLKLSLTMQAWQHLQTKTRNIHKWHYSKTCWQTGPIEATSTKILCNKMKLQTLQDFDKCTISVAQNCISKTFNTHVVLFWKQYRVVGKKN